MQQLTASEWFTDMYLLQVKTIAIKFTVKTNLRFGECYTCFGYETKTRVAYFGKISM